MINVIEDFKQELRENIKNRCHSKEMLYQIEKSNSALEIVGVLNKFFAYDFEVIPKNLKKFFDSEVLSANNIFTFDKNYKKVQSGTEKMITLHDSELKLTLEGNGCIDISMFDNSKAIMHICEESKVTAHLKHNAYAKIIVSEKSSIKVLLHNHSRIDLSSFGKCNVFIQALDWSKVGANCSGASHFTIEAAGESYSVVRNDGDCPINYHVIVNDYDSPNGGCPIIKDLNNRVLHTSKFWKIQQVKN